MNITLEMPKQSIGKVFYGYGSSSLLDGWSPLSTPSLLLTNINSSPEGKGRGHSGSCPPPPAWLGAPSHTQQMLWDEGEPLKHVIIIEEEGMGGLGCAGRDSGSKSHPSCDVHHLAETRDPLMGLAFANWCLRSWDSQGGKWFLARRLFRNPDSRSLIHQLVLLGKDTKKCLVKKNAHVKKHHVCGESLEL